MMAVPDCITLIDDSDFPFWHVFECGGWGGIRMIEDELDQCNSTHHHKLNVRSFVQKKNIYMLHKIILSATY